MTLVKPRQTFSRHGHVAFLVVFHEHHNIQHRLEFLPSSPHLVVLGIFAGWHVSLHPPGVQEGLPTVRVTCALPPDGHTARGIHSPRQTGNLQFVEINPVKK